MVLPDLYACIKFTAYTASQCTCRCVVLPDGGIAVVAVVLVMSQVNQDRKSVV